MKPAFLPLNTEFYNAFKAGLKVDEYRLKIGRFREKNFLPGRRIILSKGYGKKDRIEGVIETCFVINLDELPEKDQKDVLACYGDKAIGHKILVIRINIDGVNA